MHYRGNKKKKLASIHDICVRIEKSLRQYMCVKRVNLGLCDSVNNKAAETNLDTI